MSYYEDRIKALEARIEEMATLNRMKAVPVEAKLMDRIGELNKENARLKAEVERLTAFTTRTIIPNEELQAQVERLTAENESLQTKATNIYNAMVVRCRIEEITHKANADSIISQGMMSEAMKLMEESIAIREQVERLTKAGDAMRDKLCWCYLDGYQSTKEAEDAWNAAKKGGQP